VPNSGARIQLKIQMKECTGNVFIATFTAASAPKADATTAFAKELIVPFWLVKATGDKDRANMHRSTVVYKTSMATGKEEGTCDPVLVPILQNTRPLKEGEELLTYDGDMEAATHSMPQVPAITQSPKKRTAAPAPTTVQPPKKKAAASRGPKPTAIKRLLKKK